MKVELNSALSQIAQLDEAVNTLQTSNDHLKKEVTRLRSAQETLRHENEKKSK